MQLLLICLERAYNQVKIWWLALWLIAQQIGKDLHILKIRGSKWLLKVLAFSRKANLILKRIEAPHIVNTGAQIALGNVWFISNPFV